MKHLKLKFIIIGILLGLLLGCKFSRMSQEEINLATMHRYAEALNTFNYDQLDECIKPDFIRHSQASGDQQIKSLEEYKLFYQEWANAFPDAHTTIHVLFAKDDMIASYATLTGTQTGSFGSLPATGKKMKSDFIGILRFEDGKIAEVWVEWDNLAILEQLGYFPPPDTAKE